MAFSIDGLKVLVQNGQESPDVWVYNSTDSMATITANDYFLAEYKKLSVGDVIVVSSSTGGTRQTHATVVTASSSSTVTVSEAINLNSGGAMALTRSTIADAGTVTVAQHRGRVLYQDASGGAVTMTTATGTNLAAEFTELAIGDGIMQYLASNHATNTSTIAGGTGVTLVGSGAVINTGGSFALIKTAAATFDLVRVG